jgi:hypothetical protein
MSTLPRPAALLALAALAAALGGCTVLAVGGAGVGAGGTGGATAVSAGVAVGKGVVSVASAPFGSGKDK